MNSIVNHNQLVASNINRYFVCEMKIFTYIFMPSLFYPFSFHPRFWEYGRIVGKRLETIIETVFLSVNCLEAQRVPMSQDRSLIKRVDGLMDTLFYNNPHASG